MSAIKQLLEFGQSPWNDNLTRAPFALSASQRGPVNVERKR